MEEKEENFCTLEKSGNIGGADAADNKDHDPNILGKFKDVNALAEAYNALQSEFTRRSQRLKALEKQAENSCTDPDRREGTVQEPACPENQDTPAATPERKTVAVAEQKTVSDDEIYRLVSENEQVRLKILGDYLSSLKKSDAPIMKGGAGVPITPRTKAKSIDEAGNMALLYFKNGND